MMRDNRINRRELLLAAVLGAMLTGLGTRVCRAQTVLTLDSCRAMALRSGKQMGVARLRQQVAANVRRAARTKFLPHVSAIGTYQYTSEEISLLSGEQKSALSHIGTNTSGALATAGQGVMGQLSQIGGALAQMGVPTDALTQMGQQLQQQMGQTLTNTAGLLDTEGQKIVDAFRTDTRNIFAGSVVVTQPLFMGGAIVAMNRMADLGEQLAGHQADARLQETVYATDQAYWQVVSLKHKKRLAESFLQLVKKLDHDVQSMIAEGVATRSEGLSVSVKVNEAEMTLSRVADGLVLSRMLLCQLTGLPLDADIVLADEDAPTVATVAPAAPPAGVQQALANRPELKMLENTVDLGRQATNMLRAANLPQVALTGGYAVSNPNVLNGYEKKFGGFWNVGLLVRVPIWNWGDNMYKVRAAKGATAIASLELEEAREKIELQVSQSEFKVTEASKRLAMAESNTARADENLRTANLGFSEGVISAATVMEAQTAWLQAQSQKIDAEIDVRLSQADLQKSLGTLLP